MNNNTLPWDWVQNQWKQIVQDNKCKPISLSSECNLLFHESRLMPGQPSIQCISLSQAVSNILPHKELNQKLNLISWARQPSELRQKSTSMVKQKPSCTTGNWSVGGWNWDTHRTSSLLSHHSRSTSHRTSFLCSSVTCTRRQSKPKPLMKWLVLPRGLKLVYFT